MQKIFVLLQLDISKTCIENFIAKLKLVVFYYILYKINDNIIKLKSVLIFSNCILAKESEIKHMLLYGVKFIKLIN